MRTYHVHIYKVTSMAEIDIEVHSSLEAKIKALDKKGDLKYKKSDCKYIALDFLKSKK